MEIQNKGSSGRKIILFLSIMPFIALIRVYYNLYSIGVQGKFLERYYPEFMVTVIIFLFGLIYCMIGYNKSRVLSVPAMLYTVGITVAYRGYITNARIVFVLTCIVFIITLFAGKRLYNLSIVLSIISLVMHMIEMFFDFMKYSDYGEILVNVITMDIFYIVPVIIFLLTILFMNAKEDAKNEFVLKTKSIGKNIVLTLLTFGIYKIIWLISISKQIKYINKERMNYLGEILCIMFVPFYGLYWVITRAKKIAYIGNNYGLNISDNGILYLILNFFFLDLITYALMQNDLNSIIMGIHNGKPETFNYTSPNLNENCQNSSIWQPMPTCSKCGQAVDNNAAFCSECGEKIIQLPKQKKCSNCGDTMDAASKFCSRCGTPN